MRNKILIGAGIVLSIFILFLIIICGASTGGNNTLPETELKQVISGVTCEIKDEEPIHYDISLLIDNKQYNDEIKSKNYSKINLNINKNIKSLGISFIVKSNINDNIKFTLMNDKNILKTTSLDLEKNVSNEVNLALEKSVDILSTNEFYILIESTNNSQFIFDNFLMFLTEV